MEKQSKLKLFIEKIKQKKIALILSLLFSFLWAVCKIIFGVFSASYFFCVSGASALLFGFIKKIYLKHHDIDDLDEKRGKSITIAILLTVSGILFTFIWQDYFSF